MSTQEKLLLITEPIWLAIVFFAFWYPTPLRENWLWLLILFIPVLWLRWKTQRQLLSPTPLNALLLIFLILSVLNIYIAPYTRGLTILARLTAGMILFTYGVEHGRKHGHINGLISVELALGILIGILSLGASQWTMKSLPLMFIIEKLPTVRGFPGFEAGANVNEIAGAISLILPSIAALAIYRWRTGEKRAWVTTAFILLALGLFLGQSRMAILGVLVVLFIFALLLIPRGVWRYLALTCLVLVTILQALLITDILIPPDANFDQTDRNELSLASRLEIYHSGFEIIADYPLTGVGISFFRYEPVRSLYPVSSFRGRILPHAHNEFIQVGTDLGIPGLLVFIGWYAALAYMLVDTWQRGTDADKVLAAGLGGALLAHAIYGMGDAITLWDRFIFLFWLLVSMVGGQYIAVRTRHE